MCGAGKRGTNRKIQRSCERYTAGGELISATEIMAADVYLTV